MNANKAVRARFCRRCHQGVETDAAGMRMRMALHALRCLRWDMRHSIIRGFARVGA